MINAREQGRIVVTGGAGFIGSALVWHLNQLGFDDILIVDRLGETEKWQNLRALRFADYLEADDFLRRVETTPEALGAIGTTYHLGACSSTTETDAAYLIRNNFEYTKTLAHWAVARDTRFVYASSAATYGALEHDLSETRPLASLRPLNMYGYSKHLFDCYAERSGLLPRIVGLKYFNVFGPNEGEKGEMRSLVNKAFDQVLATGTIRLFRSYRDDYAHGEQRRDFLYVKDAVAMTAFLAMQESTGGLYNLGSGQASSWLELAGAIFAALGAEPRVELIEMPEALRPKYQYYTCADIGRLREAGYSAPLTPLDEAVADYIRNYLQPRLHLGDEPALAAGG